MANEPHASVVHYNGSDVNTLATAALVPVKECNDYYKLGDIIANGHNLNSLHANVLAAIRHVCILFFSSLLSFIITSEL